MKKIFLLFLLFFVLPLSAEQAIEMIVLNVDDTHCHLGGVEIVISEDKDSSGALDDDEITYVFICNGESGCNMVSTAQRRYNFEECPADDEGTPGDGVVITSGFDCNGDGSIDNPNEVTEMPPICSGKNGADGSNGTATAVGSNAANGTDGTNGKVSEIVVSEEPKGENCKEGGTKIETRFDANKNGSFDNSEITVKYVCNGSDGDQGSQGEPGKTSDTSEIDGNIKDGAQGDRGDKGEQGEQGEAGEKGETGSDGFNSLVSVVDEAAGDNCEYGGKKFMSGLDKDGNGVLDESEVKNSYYICNGNNAVEASEAAASSGCSLTLF